MLKPGIQDSRLQTSIPLVAFRDHKCLFLLTICFVCSLQLLALCLLPEPPDSPEEGTSAIKLEASLCKHMGSHLYDWSQGTKMVVIRLKIPSQNPHRYLPIHCLQQWGLKSSIYLRTVGEGNDEQKVHAQVVQDRKGSFPLGIKCYRCLHVSS